MHQAILQWAASKDEWRAANNHFTNRALSFFIWGPKPTLKAQTVCLYGCDTQGMLDQIEKVVVAFKPKDADVFRSMCNTTLTIYRSDGIKITFKAQPVDAYICRTDCPDAICLPPPHCWIPERFQFEILYPISVVRPYIPVFCISPRTYLALTQAT